MNREDYQPDPQMLEEGWHLLDVMPQACLTDDFKESQRARFEEIAFHDSDYGEALGQKYIEIYAKGFRRPPQCENPGGGFVLMGRADTEPTSRLEEGLAHEFMMRRGRLPKSTMTVKEPFYQPSPVCLGQFEKSDRFYWAVWMR